MTSKKIKQDQSLPANSVKRRAQSLGEVIRDHSNTSPPPILFRGIKVGSIGFVFGVSKSGKTTFMEHLLLSISAGRTEFIGYPVNCLNRICFFVSYEENSWNRLERNQLQLHDFTEVEQERIKVNYVVSNQEMPSFVVYSDDWLALEDEIAFHRPGVVVIDSLSRLTLDDNASEEVAKHLMKRLREICTKYECTVIIINHTPKGANEKPLSIASMSGSRIFMQEADFLIGINRTIDNTRYIKLVAARYDKDDYDRVDSFVINQNRCIEITGKILEIEALGESDGRIDSTNADAIFDEMKTIVNDTQIDVINIDDIKHLHETGLMSKVTFYKSITKLIEKGWVRRMPGKGMYQITVA